MRRLIPFILSLYLLSACGGSPPRPDSPVLRPQTTDELLAAVAHAATHPKTKIVLVKNGRYVLADTLYLRGNGTTLDQNGSTLAYNAHYDGIHGSAAVAIIPVLGDPVPWTGQTGGFIWDNEPGTVGRMEVAAGGALTEADFREPAPVQYPGPQRSTYTRARKILTPAENITIKNGTITTLDHAAYIALEIGWARNVTANNLTITGQWYFGTAQVVIQESEYVNAGRVAGSTIQVNSSTFVGIRNSVLAGGVECEEMVRFLTVDNTTLQAIRSNDLLCSNWKVTNCTFTESDWNPGTIQLWEQGGNMEFSGNKMAGPGWAGGKGTVLLRGNNGPAYFSNYSATPEKIVSIQNSWPDSPQEQP